MLEKSVKSFDNFTKKPEQFLGVQNDVAGQVRHLIKDLYDFAKKQEDNKHVQALPELIIEDFDDEQIWQELELQNNAKYNSFVTDVSKLIASKDKLNFGLPQKKAKDKKSTKKSSATVKPKGVINVNDDQKVDSKNNERQKKVKSKPNELKQKKYVPRSSIVDDRFFKLHELQEFLDKEDRKEARENKNKNKNADEDSDVESVDLFGNIISDQEDQPRYNEFFDVPGNSLGDLRSRKRKRSGSFDENSDVTKESDLEEEGEEEEDFLRGEPKTKEKQVRFDLAPASSAERESENEESTEKVVNLPKSNFEARQERLQARIRQMEEAVLAEKPWQLMGEVSSANRPENCLLEEVLEFDMTTRPAPVITEQTTMKLEDIIKQRIKDKVWDDVERKVKPTLAPDEYKKTVVMDQEKSKLSLAEIYEQEYLKQKGALEPDAADEKPVEEPPEHRAIRAVMSSLFLKLDALSNYYYTPKPVVPETKIVSNLPAITMEEVAPVAVSDAALLAPEEVKAKTRGDVMGKAERTKTDKKRERRKKKARQRYRKKEVERREKIVEKLRPGLGNKYSKEKMAEKLKKLANCSNVHQLEDKGKDKAVRSSSAFFSHLQEEVVNHNKSKGQGDKLRPGPENKNSKDGLAARLKKLANYSNVCQEDKGKGKAVQSSSAFFSRLQEEVVTHIQSKVQENTKNKGKAVVSAKKLKL